MGNGNLEQGKRKSFCGSLNPSEFSHRSMNVLVLGATGHIGSAIVRECLSQGWEVTAVSRRREPPLNLNELPIHYLSGDIDTPGQIDIWTSGHDVVIDAAAPYPLYLLPTN